ncbi:MAG: hypothetical protein IPL87_04685 [Candidatus Moraniibacteriota bacterium]|nr:MAG: hypothetical protein IPL87_04685 [Candidatus Moranbacteria bacterium]
MNTEEKQKYRPSAFLSSKHRTIDRAAQTSYSVLEKPWAFVRGIRRKTWQGLFL